MAGMIELYRQSFTDTNSVVIQHDLNMEYVGAVRLVVDAQVRNELIDKVSVSKEDPLNSLTVSLKQVCTGYIQVISTSYVRVGQRTTAQASASRIWEFAKQEGELQTNSMTVKDAVVLTTIPLPPGDYMIEWSGESKVSKLNNSAMIKVVVDGGASLCDSYFSSSEWGMFSGFDKITTTELGPITVRLQYCSERGGKVAAYVRRATLRLKPLEE